MSTQDESTDKPPRRSLDEALRETWLSALGAVERTEAELHRLVERVREAAVGDESLAAELAARVRQAREDLERRVDDGVRHALARTMGPLTDEIAALRDRMDRLATRLDEQAALRAARRVADDASAGDATPGSATTGEEPAAGDPSPAATPRDAD
jgi:hypothetical protein